MRDPASLLRVAVFSAVLLTGCSQPSTPVRTYNMGEKVVLGHLTYTVFETQWLTQAGTPPDLRMPQHRFFLVRLSVNNSGGGDVMAPSLSVVDDKGTDYPELQNGDKIPQWIGFLRNVHPAEAASGNAVFDCPAGHYKLKVTDEEGEHSAFVDIPLNFTNETPDMPTPGGDAKKGPGIRPEGQ